MAAERCGGCDHAAHSGACRGKAASGCVPFTSSLRDGTTATGFLCGSRPSCPCYWRRCLCGAALLYAQCDDDPASYESVLMGSAGSTDGTLAVRKLADGCLASRYLPEDEEPRPGEQRMVDHDRWCRLAKRRGITEVTGPEHALST